MDNQRHFIFISIFIDISWKESERLFAVYFPNGQLRKLSCFCHTERSQAIGSKERRAAWKCPKFLKAKSLVRNG